MAKNDDFDFQHSPYFQSMLEGPFAEQNSREVELKEFVEPALMGQVLHFLYFKSGEILT